MTTKRTPAANVTVAALRQLEDAGAHWKMPHVCALTGYSESYIRRSDCPKLRDDETGRVYFEPAAVRAWWAGRLKAKRSA